MIETTRTARFIALTNCFVRRKGGEGVGLFVLSWLRQFQREIAIQCPAPAPAAGTGLWKEKKKMSQVILLAGTYYLGRGGFGSISSGVAIFFFFVVV